MTGPDFPSLADDLAKLAAQMLIDDVGAHNQAIIRRAVSTAYYALFHRLCELCADALVGKDKSHDVYVTIYRLLDHGPVKNLLNQTKEFEKEVFGTIDKFRELQDARIWADYDPSPGRDVDEGHPFPTEKAKELVDFAQSAISTLNALGDDKRLSFAAQLIGKARGKPRQGS